MAMRVLEKDSEIMAYEGIAGIDHGWAWANFMAKGLGFEKGISLLIGIGSYWAWASVSMVTASLWQTGSADLSHASWLVNVVAHCVSLLAFAALSAKTPIGFHGRTATTLFPAIVIGGTALLSIGYANGDFTALVFAGSAVSGIGTAGMLMLWCEPYARLNQVSEQRLILGGSIVAGMLIALLIPNLPGLAAIGTTLLLPAVTSLCVKHVESLDSKSDATSLRSAPEPTVAHKENRRAEAGPPFFKTIFQQGKRNVAILFICCFILALPTGLFQNWHTYTEAGGNPSGWNTILSCVCMLIVIAICLDYYFMEKRSTFVFSRLVIPLIAGGLLIIPSLASGKSTSLSGFESWAGVLTLTGYHLFLVYAYTEFGLLASEARVPAHRVFAWGTSAIDIGLIAGTALVSAIQHFSSTWAIGITFGVVYLLLLVGILLFPKVFESVENRERDKAAVLKLRSGVGKSGASGGNPLHDIEGRCGVVARMYGLSAREQDVLEYLLKGRTLQSIANETFLSYNTVKTHVSHIYQKTGVHSRDELIDLLDKIE